MEGGTAHDYENYWCAFGVPPAPVYKGGEEEVAGPRGGAPWGESY